MSIYIYLGPVRPVRFTFEKCNVHTHDTLYTVAINFLDIEYVGVNLLSRFIFSKVLQISRDRSSSKFESFDGILHPPPPNFHDKTVDSERRSTTVLRLILFFYYARLVFRIRGNIEGWREK